MASDKAGKLALIIFAVAVFFSYTQPYHIHPYRTFYHDLTICLGLTAAVTYLAVGRQANLSPGGSDTGMISAMISATQPNPAWFVEARLRFPFLLVLPLGIAFVILLQAFTGMIEPLMITAFPVIYLLMFALSIVFGASLALDARRVEPAAMAVALAHLLAAVVSLVFQHIQILGIDATPLVMYMAKNADVALRPYANVAQPNQLALLYFFSLAAIWFFYRSNKLPVWACVGLAAMILWGAVLTQSRIGWILVPLFFTYTISQLGRHKSGAILIMLALVAMYALLTIFLPQIGQAIGFSGGSVAEHVGGRSERTVLWQTAWYLARQHPWFGIGWFGYGTGQVDVAADFASSTYAEHAHNLILNLAAELGLPVTLLVTAGLCWWFYQTCCKPPKSIALQFATLCFFAMGVHSMVEFPLWYGFVLIPVGVLMGMVHQMRWPTAGSSVKPGVVLAGFAICVAVMAGVTLDYQRVIAGFKVLRNIQAGYSPQEKYLRKPQFTLFPQFFDYFRLTRTKPREGMSQDEIAYVEAWTRRFGFVHILNIEAEVYVLNGQPQKALRAMQTLQRLHPIYYPEYYDYWQAKSKSDKRFKAIFDTMPPRDAP